MRKFIAIAAALGFLGTTSLTPVFAASQNDFGSASTDLSAAKKKAKKPAKKAKKKAKKTTALISEDFSSAKKKAKKPAKKAKKKAAKKKTADNVIVYRIAA